VVLPVFNPPARHIGIPGPLVTAIKSSPLNAPRSLTSDNTLGKFLAWNWPTRLGTIPPHGSERSSDRRIMLCSIRGGRGVSISSTATQVSSHEVSIPRTLNERVHCRCTRDFTLESQRSCEERNIQLPTRTDLQKVYKNTLARA
jgi:hypothetical protein